MTQHLNHHVPLALHTWHSVTTHDTASLINTQRHWTWHGVTGSTEWYDWLNISTIMYDLPCTHDTASLINTQRHWTWHGVTGSTEQYDWLNIGWRRPFRPIKRHQLSVVFASSTHQYVEWMKWWRVERLAPHHVQRNMRNIQMAKSHCSILNVSRI